jgi:ABC-type Fe3+-hydroxamate transport system substrate-binding protein
MKFPPIFPKKLAISAIVVVAMFAATSMFVVFDANESSADSSFTVTDGVGTSFTFSAATSHIVTMGYGATLTVAELGQMSKIVAIDKYSQYSYTKNETLNGIDEQAVDLGSLYSSTNNDNVLVCLSKLVEERKMTKDDAVILTGSSNATAMGKLLTDNGFTHVLVYTSITNYSDVVSFVKTMSYIVTESESSSSVNKMTATLTTIDSRLSSVTVKSEGLFVWYSSSSGSFSVGNTGSIAVSLIEAAGGTNIGRDNSKTARTYGDKSTIVNLISGHKNAVIFLDSNYYNAGKTTADFRADVLGNDTSITVIKMSQIWNNYCPDAADGLWTFACSLYPDLFSGDVPSGEGVPSEDYTVYYAFAAVAVVALVLVAGFFYMRK